MRARADAVSVLLASMAYERDLRKGEPWRQSDSGVAGAASSAMSLVGPVFRKLLGRAKEQTNSSALYGWRGMAASMRSCSNRRSARIIVGVVLVERAVAVARERAMEWVHVDYEPYLRTFYQGSGFVPTDAGIIHLRPDAPAESGVERQ